MGFEYVGLTPKELQEKGLELANKVVEAAGIKREKESAVKDFKLRLDVANKEIVELTQIVTTGEEMRETTFFDTRIDN